MSARHELLRRPAPPPPNKKNKTFEKKKTHAKDGQEKCIHMRCVTNEAEFVAAVPLGLSAPGVLHGTWSGSGGNRLVDCSRVTLPETNMTLENSHFQ